MDCAARRPTMPGLPSDEPDATGRPPAAPDTSVRSPADPDAADQARVARWLALSRVLLGEARDDSGVLIHFRCVNPSHLNVADRVGGRVTSHERRWAYCNDPGAETDHSWEATGGVSVELLRIEQRRLLEVLSERRRQVSEITAAHRPEPASAEDADPDPTLAGSGAA